MALVNGLNPVEPQSGLVFYAFLPTALPTDRGRYILYESLISPLLVKQNNLSDLPNPSAARSSLGLGSMALQQASAVSITGGSITNITPLAISSGGTGASTSAQARINLGLGSLAVQPASDVLITGGSATNLTNLSSVNLLATNLAVTNLTVNTPLSVPGTLTVAAGLNSAILSPTSLTMYGMQLIGAPRGGWLNNLDYPHGWKTNGVGGVIPSRVLWSTPVTLQQVAATLLAVIQDLMAHGLLSDLALYAPVPGPPPPEE